MRVITALISIEILSFFTFKRNSGRMLMAASLTSFSSSRRSYEKIWIKV
jgi:hypothetical protein